MEILNLGLKECRNICLSSLRDCLAEVGGKYLNQKKFAFYFIFFLAIQAGPDFLAGVNSFLDDWNWILYANIICLLFWFAFEERDNSKHPQVAYSCARLMASVTNSSFSSSLHGGGS